jgi:hypothetical protein
LEKSNVNIEGYSIGAQFYRVLYEKGGVITYVHNSLKFTNIDLSEYCKEKDIEICAVKLTIHSLNMTLITIYRFPSGNFTFFLQNLNNVLQSLYTPSTHIIICGDLNINYLVENDQRKQLDNLLLMYNLTGIVNFPMRISNSSASAIDNIFIDISRLEDFSIIPFPNDLSDHDAQILTINIPIQMQSDRSRFVRKVNKHTILDFTYNLSNESWEGVFNNDVNLMFNSFLNTHLRIFYSCFPLVRSKSRKLNNNWITLGIKISCKRKRELFQTIRKSNNPALKQYYKVYCKILVNVIKEAKGMTFNKRILKSNNKLKLLGI